MSITPSETRFNTSELPVKQQLAILAVIMFLVFGIGYGPDVLRSFDENSTPTPAAAQEPLTPGSITPTNVIDYYDDVTIQARSAYVWDVANQRVLYQKSPDVQLPLASITKLMTALVAHELLESGSEVTITREAITQDGNSGLEDGESFTLRHLLDLTLLSSSNDGAYAIAAAAGAQLTDENAPETFVEAMNIRAGELGFTQTYFKNPTGLDISETESGAYGTAREVTFLMEYILTHFPEILEATRQESTTVASDFGATHQAENTNPIVERIPGLIGSKTGYTDLAGGNLTVAFDAAFNRPIIVVVLGSSHTGRFDDVLSLVDRAQKTVAQ